MSTRAPIAPASAATATAAPSRPCAPAATSLALGHDLRALLREAARHEELVLQLRHQNARLAVARPLADPDVRLTLPALASGPVVGHVGRCGCCGSPGRVVVHDQDLRGVFQLCAAADFAPAAWMDLILDLLPRDLARVSAAPISSAEWGRAAVPASDAAPARQLCELLNRVWADALAFELELRAGDFSLATTFVPEAGSAAAGLLTLRSADSTAQLFLGAVTRLAIVPSGLDPALEIHTTAPGEKLVLRSAAPAWRRALADLAVALG